MNIIEAMKAIVLELGLGGVFVATALEYGCFPISSEILLPFIGYITGITNKSLIQTIIFATMGGMFGTSICYLLGRIGGNFIMKFIDNFNSLSKGIKKSEDIFNKYGKLSIFFARLCPIARTYISFPAGFFKMSALPFFTYTFLGVSIWNTLLIGLGYFLGSNFTIIKEFFNIYSTQIGIIVALIAISSIIFKKINS